jgi:hypothetical protein
VQLCLNGCYYLLLLSFCQCLYLIFCLPFSSSSLLLIFSLFFFPPSVPLRSRLLNFPLYFSKLPSFIPAFVSISSSSFISFRFMLFCYQFCFLPYPARTIVFNVIYYALPDNPILLTSIRSRPLIPFISYFFSNLSFFFFLRPASPLSHILFFLHLSSFFVFFILSSSFFSLFSLFLTFAPSFLLYLRLSPSFSHHSLSPFFSLCISIKFILQLLRSFLLLLNFSLFYFFFLSFFPFLPFIFLLPHFLLLFLNLLKFLFLCLRLCQS